MLLSVFYSSGGGWLYWVVFVELSAVDPEFVFVVLSEFVPEKPELGLVVLPESAPVKPVLGLFVLPESVTVDPGLGLVMLPESVPVESELGLVVLSELVLEPSFYKLPSEVLFYVLLKSELELELSLSLVKSGVSYYSGLWLKSKFPGTQVVITLQTVWLAELFDVCELSVIFSAFVLFLLVVLFVVFKASVPFLLVVLLFVVFAYEQTVKLVQFWGLTTI